jgi:hypothetical protein
MSRKKERKGERGRRQVGSAGQREGGRESAGWLEAGCWAERGRRRWAEWSRPRAGEGRRMGRGEREPARGGEEEQAGLGRLGCFPITWVSNPFLFLFLVFNFKPI